MDIEFNFTIVLGETSLLKKQSLIATLHKYFVLTQVTQKVSITTQI